MHTDEYDYHACATALREWLRNDMPHEGPNRLPVGITGRTIELLWAGDDSQRKLAAFPKMLEALKLLEVDGFTDHTDEALANCAINGQVWDKRLAQQEISRRTALSLAEEAL